MFAQIPRYRRSTPCPTPNTKPMQLRLFVRIFIREQPQGVTRGSTLEEHTCSILWNMSSVPQLGELRRGYILWLCARWNKFWVGLRYLNFRPSFMRSVENSGLRWWCWTSRMEKKKRLGASSYCTIYAVLILCFVVLAYLAMSCVANRSWYLIPEQLEGASLGEAGCGRLWHFSWTHLWLDLWKALRTFWWFRIRKTDICWYVAWGRFVLLCYRKRTSLSEALRT